MNKFRKYTLKVLKSQLLVWSLPNRLLQYSLLPLILFLFLLLSGSLDLEEWLRSVISVLGLLVMVVYVFLLVYRAYRNALLASTGQWRTYLFWESLELPAPLDLWKFLITNSLLFSGFVVIVVFLQAFTITGFLELVLALLALVFYLVFMVFPGWFLFANGGEIVGFLKLAKIIRFVRADFAVYIIITGIVGALILLGIVIWYLPLFVALPAVLAQILWALGFGFICLVLVEILPFLQAYLWRKRMDIG